MRLLSKGKVWDRFFSLLPHIKEFLREKRQIFHELHMVAEHELLSDITGQLNQMNLKLQVTYFVTELYEEIGFVPIILS